MTARRYSSSQCKMKLCCKCESNISEINLFKNTDVLFQHLTLTVNGLSYIHFYHYRLTLISVQLTLYLFLILKTRKR